MVDESSYKMGKKVKEVESYEQKCSLLHISDHSSSASKTAAFMMLFFVLVLLRKFILTLSCFIKY